RESAETIRDIAQQCLARRFHEHDPSVELVLSHFYGAAVCRDLHDVTLSIVERVLRAPDPPYREGELYGRRESITEQFELDAGLEYKGHPASALHGPFANLLTAHPRVGLRLIAETLNRTSRPYLASCDTDFEFSFAPGAG